MQARIFTHVANLNKLPQRLLQGGDKTRLHPVNNDHHIVFSQMFCKCKIQKSCWEVTVTKRITT